MDYIKIKNLFLSKDNIESEKRIHRVGEDTWIYKTLIQNI